MKGGWLVAHARGHTLRARLLDECTFDVFMDGVQPLPRRAPLLARASAFAFFPASASTFWTSATTAGTACSTVGSAYFSGALVSVRSAFFRQPLLRSSWGHVLSFVQAGSTPTWNPL